jgi:hypothetical protein
MQRKYRHIVIPFHKGEKRAFAMFYVYPQSGKPVVVSGRHDQVKVYVHENFPRSFYRYVFWSHGQSRGAWSSPMPIYFRPVKIGKKTRWSISFMDQDGNLRESALLVRRIPHKWPLILNQAALKYESSKTIGEVPMRRSNRASFRADKIVIPQPNYEAGIE